jgi:Xaa-Pro dipeptidase
VNLDHRGRLERVREAMREAGLDCIVATRGGAIAYLAGAMAPWRSAVILPQQGEAELVTVTYDAQRLIDRSWLTSIRDWEMADPDGFARTIAEALVEHGVHAGRIGVDLLGAQSVGAISATEYFSLQAALPDAELVDGSATLDATMILKEPEEIELLRRAAEIADLGVEAAFDAIAVGRTELAIAGVAELAMREAGNEFVWSVTGTEVGAGYRQSYPLCFTDMPSEKRVQVGDAITVDLHPSYRCYLGDLAANAVLGRPSSRQSALAEAWQQVAHAILEGLRPGSVISDVARSARETAEALGYGPYTVPFYGHGLGTDARIPHALTETNDGILEPSMLVEIDLQMTLPGEVGMRLETAVLITDTGHETLNKTPIELRVIDA